MSIIGTRPDKGLVIWGLFVPLRLFLGPAFLLWPGLLLSFALIFLVPYTLQKQQLIPTKLYGIALALGVLASFSLLLPPIPLAGTLTLPWFLFSIWLFFFRFRESGTLLRLSQLSLLYLIVGTFWLLSNRFDLTIFGFDSVISFLTAAHFHYAGFLLTILASMLLAENRSEGDRFLIFGLIAAAPLTAAGITLSRYGLLPEVEAVAACLMAATGSWVAIRYLQTDWPLIGKMGALLLLAGMVLALGYGIRIWYPIKILNIPWMYKVHGSLNTVGLGLMVLLAKGKSN
ncbi:MAG: YndJ family transporter [Bacteroidetes bacterium]|nr:YndJ family transporter [Bacteroidota bacterium]